MRETVEAILARDVAMPVRALEELRSGGEAGFGMLVLAVRESLVKHSCPGYALWASVTLGEVGDADAVPELAMLLRLASRAGSVDVGFATAEAVGRIGAAGEDDLLTYACQTPRHERYWFHYAAACLGTEKSADWLLGELEGNLALADSAGLALAMVGRTDALPALDRVLRRASTWQLVALDAAVTALHRGESPIGTYTQDWRLRYRYCSSFGRFPALLPCLTAMLRSNPRGRRETAASGRSIPRSVDAIIAASRKPAGREWWCHLCRSLEARVRNGLVLCDACAGVFAQFQARWLLDTDARTNDVFDILNTVDAQLCEHDRSRREPDDAFVHGTVVRSTCHWLVEQGVESVAAGAAMILAEADADGVAARAAALEPEPDS